MSDQSVLPAVSSPCPDKHQKRSCPIRLKVASLLLTILVLFRSRDLLDFDSSYNALSNASVEQRLLPRSHRDSPDNDIDILRGNRNKNAKQAMPGPSAGADVSHYDLTGRPKSYAKSTPVFNLGKNQTLCKLDGFQVVCATTPRKETVAALPMFADYFVDGDGKKWFKQSSLPSRPIATSWFQPDPAKFCGGQTLEPCANLGDELGPMLLLKLSGIKLIEKRYDGMDVVVIGSVLNYMVKKYSETVKRIGSYYNLTVWGTGTKWGAKGVCFDFRAVRGPKTREKYTKMGCNVPEVYGDPALLFPYVYNPRKSIDPDVDLCIVPHMGDLANEFDWWKKNNGTSLLKRFSYFDHQILGEDSANATRVRLLDIRTPDAAAFIDTLSTCKLVASASLHGLILSEAYNITWSWIQLRDKHEASFKYNDFFLSVGINPDDAKVCIRH
eukprot:CCRYP_011570-RC/>CCRYP_011570-RC protein AED:0.04 eAED:0.04 QI:408/1/1/1/0.66/0.5/4/363/440